MTESNEYTSPVSRLLELAECDWSSRKDWLDYASLGINSGHTPELIQIATDPKYLDASDEDNTYWAPVHAWRALAQLKAVEAVEPLIGLLCRIEEKDDDWILEEFPVVFSLIGRQAAPALMSYVQNKDNYLFARVAALEGVIKIGKNDSDYRSQCVEFLRASLRGYAEDNEGINANYISGLMDLGDVDSAALMEEAFEAGYVDEMIIGDWEDVQIEMGLISERITPKKSYWGKNFNAPRPPDYSNQQKAAKKRKEKSRCHNKQARKARRKNRKKP